MKHLEFELEKLLRLYQRHLQTSWDGIEAHRFFYWRGLSNKTLDINRDKSSVFCFWKTWIASPINVFALLQLFSRQPAAFLENFWFQRKNFPFFKVCSNDRQNVYTLRQKVLLCISVYIIYFEWVPNVILIQLVIQ